MVLHLKLEPISGYVILKKESIFYSFIYSFHKYIQIIVSSPSNLFQPSPTSLSCSNLLILISLKKKSQSPKGINQTQRKLQCQTQLLVMLSLDAVTE